MSKPFSFSTLDYKKILKGLLIALGGATLTYLSSVLTGMDFGPLWTPAIMTFWSAFVNTARIYFSETKNY